MIGDDDRASGKLTTRGTGNPFAVSASLSAVALPTRACAARRAW